MQLGPLCNEYSTGGQCSLEQYSTQRQTLPQRSASRDLQGLTKGKPGLNITKQISVQCKVCTCVAIPRYKSCLNNTAVGGSWRWGRGEGGSRIGNK